MMLAARRALSALVLGVLVVLGSAGTSARAESPSPAATASATSTGSAAPSGGDEAVDGPQDNSRQVFALAAAGGLAVAAAVVVFLRRR